MYAIYSRGSSVMVVEHDYRAANEKSQLARSRENGQISNSILYRETREGQVRDWNQGDQGARAYFHAPLPILHVTAQGFARLVQGNDRFQQTTAFGPVAGTWVNSSRRDHHS